MSKNIESIVEKLNRYYRNLPPHAKSREGGVLIKEVLEALTEKKLVMPMSEREILSKFGDHITTARNYGEWEAVAKAIYQAQFGERK